GSFTVYKDGLPVFIDIGVESYTKKTFSPQRYEIWTMQSAWHNLPSFDGVMQKDGEHYHAADVSYSLEDSSISMDIAPAYPSGSPVASYRRRARLYKEEKIHITDTFSFRDDMPHQVVLSLITYEKPQIISELSERQEISIPSAADGKDPARLFLSGGRVAAIEEIPITDARLAIAWKHPLYRILITPLP
ncbi:MAG: heparinase, partial [Eisenbergiella sp.]